MESERRRRSRPPTPSTRRRTTSITAPQSKKAFDIHTEDPRLRDRYGRHSLGQGCLMARRLIEAGVRFVTVTDGGWDTHQNNFTSLKNRLLPRLDTALSSLLRDLADRGRLDSTLVVVLSDFGRTPKVNPSAGRDHWSTAGIALLGRRRHPAGPGGRPHQRDGRAADRVRRITPRTSPRRSTIAWAFRSTRPTRRRTDGPSRSIMMAGRSGSCYNGRDSPAEGGWLTRERSSEHGRDRPGPGGDEAGRGVVRR